MKEKLREKKIVQFNGSKKDGNCNKYELKSLAKCVSLSVSI